MAELERLVEGQYALNGDVSLADIAVLGDMPGIVDGSGVSVSLANVVSADSAIAALLLQWCRQANAAGAQFKVTDCPGSVRLLLNLYDLEAMFGI